MRKPSARQLLIVAALIGIAALVYLGRRESKSPTSVATALPKSTSKIDPVTSPTYNMIEVAKQSIMLEEHLANRNKRCPDCITKHLLHMAGLCEEAQCLAGRSIADYPHLEECTRVYKQALDTYLANRKNDSVIREIQEQLRQQRKKLFKAYLLT